MIDMYMMRPSGAKRDSLAILEAQLIALGRDESEVLNGSGLDPNDNHGSVGNDDSSVCSSTLGNDDDDDEEEEFSLGDFSDDEDDGESVVTTKSQTNIRLSKTRDSAAALLDVEMERLREQQKIQIITTKPIAAKRTTSDRRLVREMSDRRLVREERA